MTQSDAVTVFRAPPRLRIAASLGIAILAVLAVRVIMTYGWLATIGIILVILVGVQLWWAILRPALRVGPDGIDVVSGRAPVHIAWKDVQRTEVGPKGTLIVSRGGVEVHSRFPAGDRATSGATATEADAAATFLAAMTAWGRRADGSAAPVYVPPVKPAK